MPLSVNSLNSSKPLLGKWPYILGFISFIPAVGVFPALVALVWGFIKAENGGLKVMGLAVLGLAVNIGLAINYSDSLFPQTVQAASQSPQAQGVVRPIAWLQPSEGLKESQKSQKPILYDFTAEWCHFCKVEKADVFEKAENAARISGAFVPVVVMDRAREEGKNPQEIADLQSKYQIRGFPTLVVQYPGHSDYKQLVGFMNEKYVMDFIAQARP